jgi:hypothetical protein
MVKFASATCSVAAILLAALHGSVIGAEVRVNGSADEVRVEAHDATPSEILAALRHHFALSYRGATDDRRLTQTFTGSLHEVVKRVLEGYNYVIDRTDGVLVVTVVSPESSTAVAPPRPAPRGRQE